MSIYNTDLLCFLFAKKVRIINNRVELRGIPMNTCKRIFIIGHPGAGKAVLAKAIAERLGWQYVNGDLGLEFNVGRMLPQIVGEHGVKSFHDCQFEILHSLKTKENIVVTTDASIVSDARNRELLSEEFTVYLKVSIPLQLERISRNPPPLLLINDSETFLNELHNNRDALYEKVASLIVDGDDSDLDHHVALVMKYLPESQVVPDQMVLDEKDIIFFHKTERTPVHLSSQQAMCMKLLAQGRSSKDIARDMNISYRTVEGHIAKAMEQLGCTSSKELIALYYDQP